MVLVPPARHLLRAKDFADRCYARDIGVDDMADAVGFSRAHFSREFKQAFGETPRAYLLTRRLEQAASLLRLTDWTVLAICTAVGLRSQGSFTTSFTRMFGMTPTAYRRAHPPAAGRVVVPMCIQRTYGRPARRTFREDPTGDDPYDPSARRNEREEAP
jgi:AraC-like DNA-binding protein